MNFWESSKISAVIPEGILCWQVQVLIELNSPFARLVSVMAEFTWLNTAGGFMGFFFVYFTPYSRLRKHN